VVAESASLNMIIHVVILNYKTKDETIQCVNSVRECTVPTDCEIRLLVVDNASSDGIERAISGQYKDVQFLQTGANLGYTGGNNAGIRWIMQQYQNPDEDERDKRLNSKEDYLFIVNNDTYFSKDFFIELVGAAKKHPKGGIFSPKIYFTKNALPKLILDENDKTHQLKNDEEVIWYAGGKFDWDNVLGSHRGVDQVDHHQFDRESQLDYASGCAMLIPYTVLEKVKGFDNKYFMYYEDVDISMRIKKAGYEVWYIPKAVMWHHNAHSSGVGSPLQTYFTTRNRLLIALKYAPVRAKLAVLREAWSFRDNELKWKAVNDFFSLRFEKGSFDIK
jgi:GT2 family glycosyltransferase